MAREPDSFNVSTWPRRTTVENSVPSRTTASAAVAPVFIARETTSTASSRRLASTSFSVSRCVAMLPGGAADGHAVQLECRNADAHGHRLAVFAAGAYALIELEIAADHRDFGQRVRTAADQSAVLERRCDLPIFNHVG